MKIRTYVNDLSVRHYYFRAGSESKLDIEVSDSQATILDKSTLKMNTVDIVSVDIYTANQDGVNPARIEQCFNTLLVLGLQ